MELKLFLLVLVIFSVNCVDIPADYCRGHNEGVLPHPDPSRCSEFVVCVLGNPFPFQCQPNQIFHPPAQDCVPGDPVTCELITVPPPTTTTVATTTTEPITTTTEPITTTTEPVTTTTEPVTTTTEQITTTTEPFTTTMEPITTTTEPVTTTTEPITTTTEPITTTTQPIITTTEPITTTTPQQSTTEPGITTTTQRPLGPPELCVGNNMRNVADPDYCFRFYWCMLGIAFPGECAPDRIFSERWRGCVLGDWDTCIPTSPILPWSFKVVKIN